MSKIAKWRKGFIWVLVLVYHGKKNLAQRLMVPRKTREGIPMLTDFVPQHLELVKSDSSLIFFPEKTITYSFS